MGLGPTPGQLEAAFCTWVLRALVCSCVEISVGLVASQVLGKCLDLVTPGSWVGPEAVRPGIHPLACPSRLSMKVQRINLL